MENKNFYYKICRLESCGKPIDQNKRRDSLFCSVICRRAYWEASGKRKGSTPLTPSSSSKIEIPKASDFTKISEVKQNEMQEISLSKLSTSQ